MSKATLNHPTKEANHQYDCENITVRVYQDSSLACQKIGDEIIGNVKILKKTKTLVFLFCELKCNDKIITSASGVWKILKRS